MKFFNKKIKIFFQILGPLIFIYILFKIDYQLFFKEISLLKWYFLILAIILVFLLIIIKALRWRIVLLSLDINISKLKCVNLHWVGTFVGIITPGRFGELIKVYFLKNKGYNSFCSFFSVILDRIADVFVLLFFNVLIFVFFFKDVGIYVIPIGFFLLLVIVFIFLLMDQRSYFNKLFIRLIGKFFLIDFKDYNRFTFSKLWQGIKGLKKKEVIYFFIYLIISWFVYFSARYAIALSLGLNLSFIDITIISSSMALMSILPISIAGLGTREATAIYFFSLFSLSKESALLFSLLVFTTDILVVSFGLIPYLKENFSIKNIKKQID
ncbi:flippase-like domain-containing protein [Patescibacteria group bacterium]|nr:flippase-like domain-containing protein [Patescibacteria group bacterium]